MISACNIEKTGKGLGTRLYIPTTEQSIGKHAAVMQVVPFHDKHGKQYS